MTQDIVRQLQSTIDKGAHLIREAEIYSDFNHPSLKQHRKAVQQCQTLHKRLMAHIIAQRRAYKALSKEYHMFIAGEI